jgi:hypothetical protein
LTKEKTELVKTDQTSEKFLKVEDRFTIEMDKKKNLKKVFYHFEQRMNL